eukprot:SAG31_NODE_5730_length_2356_cov_1.278245_4_plen_131_part_00
MLWFGWQIELKEARAELARLSTERNHMERVASKLESSVMAAEMASTQQQYAVEKQRQQDVQSLQEQERELNHLRGLQAAANSKAAKTDTDRQLAEGHVRKGYQILAGKHRQCCSLLISEILSDIWLRSQL